MSHCCNCRHSVCSVVLESRYIGCHYEVHDPLHSAKCTLPIFRTMIAMVLSTYLGIIIDAEYRGQYGVQDEVQ